MGGTAALLHAHLGHRADGFLDGLDRWFADGGEKGNKKNAQSRDPNARIIPLADRDPALAAEASPLLSMRTAAPAELPPLVHVTYGGGKDFPFCKPQARRLQVEAARLGEEGPRVEVLELPEASHFDTHFELADGASEWHAALRRVLADE